MTRSVSKTGHTLRDPSERSAGNPQLHVARNDSLLLGFVAGDELTLGVLSWDLRKPIRLIVNADSSFEAVPTAAAAGHVPISEKENTVFAMLYQPFGSPLTPPLYDMPAIAYVRQNSCRSKIRAGNEEPIALSKHLFATLLGPDHRHGLKPLNSGGN